MTENNTPNILDQPTFKRGQLVHVAGVLGVSLGTSPVGMMTEIRFPGGASAWFSTVNEVTDATGAMTLAELADLAKDADAQLMMAEGKIARLFLFGPVSEDERWKLRNDYLVLRDLRDAWQYAFGHAFRAVRDSLTPII